MPAQKKRRRTWGILDVLKTERTVVRPLRCIASGGTYFSEAMSMTKRYFTSPLSSRS
jgi:hypothetical protein